MRLARISVVALALATVFAAGAFAVIQPQKTDIEPFNHPSLEIAASFQPVTSISGIDTTPLIDSLAELGVSMDHAFVDLRGGGWSTLMPAHPLLPGSGVGNDLAWEGFAGGEPRSIKELDSVAWDRFMSYVRDHSASLRLDPDEITPRGKVTIHENGNLIQIYAPRVVSGIVVRGSYLSAVISHGNLILFGATKWGPLTTLADPALDASQALNALTGQVNLPITSTRKAATLNFVPTASVAAIDKVAPGAGYDYRLAWVLSPSIEGQDGRWEALVDAHNGELLALQDLNSYGTPQRVRVQGGVYPISNDGTPPDGTEQGGWPMTWADVTVGGETSFTDGGGNLGFCTDATVSTSLSGRFMRMNDNCGAIDESRPAGTLDLGTSAGDDCVTPAGSTSPGNTHSSRSGFFEMNQIKAQARGQLPTNGWPRAVLQANMNINSTCNAFWDGNTVNFYRSGGGCANTGELAGVFDHEWGHGMDNNDAVPSISDPGEGIADIYAALRLNTSCIGRGFFGGNCGGYGDPCTSCTGIRDIDWAKRASGVPHTVTWSIANCGGTSHCRGAVYAEAVWDLFNRDLTSPPFSLDPDTALEVATRLTYVGGGMVGSWFVNSPPFGGCGADSGYLNYLATDDDDGNLANGTPHMSAIFNAFNRHEAACGSPTVTNAGCAGGPNVAPVINSVVALDKGALVNFGSVNNGATYGIYRTDGVFGCDQGKVRVGEVSETGLGEGGGGLSYFDDGLQNGRQYWYTVIAENGAGTCFSPAATCASATPANGANLALDTEGASVVENTGDADGFLDNCEEATATFSVSSIGTGTQTNVRIVSLEPISHPETIITTGLPSTIDASLPSCAAAEASFSFQPRGMAFDDVFEVEVGITSDQLSPIVKTGIVQVAFAESDLQNFASKTFSFEAGGEGWTVTTGSFDRVGGGGGNGTTFSRQSTAFVDANCDTIRSPLLALAPTSTLTLWNNYDIEPMSSGTWYDRANVGLVDTSDNRTLVTPDGGRLYNADSSGPGSYGGCNEPEEGWADLNATWGTSSWSAGAFGAVAPAGLSQLEVIYGTDAALANRGFWFDEVTVTDVGLQVADGQGDKCLAPTNIFSDGFESGDTSAWDIDVPLQQ